MLKVHQLFFINFAIVILFSSIIAGFFLFFELKNYELKSIEHQLKTNIDLAESAIKHNDLEELSKELYENHAIRVTIIKLDGSVLTDSQKDPKSMDNHANRPEVLDALESEYGKSVRYSKSTKEELIHIAKKVAYKDSFVILRLAVTLESIRSKAIKFWLQIIMFIIASILITLVISTYLNKEISKEIKELILYTQKFSEKIYPKGEKKFLVHEFGIIYETLVRSGKKLKKVDKHKRKYDAQIRVKNRQQKDMLSAISHEFKNPIAVIKGYSDTLISEEEINENLKRRFLDKIQKNARKLNDMVDRFTLAIKLETDNFNVEKNKFNIRELIEDIKDSMQEKYAGRKVEVYCEPISLNADRTLLEIAIKNLVDNALKYSSKSVKIELDNGLLYVIDEGIGIDNSDLEDITKKFYRVSNMDWNNSMGLGLFIVNYILKSHDSKLQVKSEKGVGSRFYFDLTPLLT